MYTFTKKVIEEKNESDNITIFDYLIGKEKFNIGINNGGIGFFDKNSKYFDYNSGESQFSDFYIGLTEKGLYITRYVYRENHDHDDTEYLCLKDGNIIWIKDFHESRKYLIYIPIGSNYSEI